MSTPLFYTRHPDLAAIKRLVQEHLDPRHPFEAFSTLISALDAHCSKHYPGEDRGGWFTPRILGGASISNTPPHVVFWLYAIYMHLVDGDREPVPFLSGPLNTRGTTAITMEPTERFQVVDRHRSAHPMTDFLAIMPALTPRTWTVDTYGLPEIQPDVTVIGWHSAAQPFLMAVCSGQLLLHPGSKKVLDPLSTMTQEDEKLFFREPVIPARLERHRERLVEVFGTPLEAFEQSSDSARQVVEAYLARLD